MKFSHAKVSVPFWVSFLGEAMSVWKNKYTCPGFVFWSSKPHPKGDDYSTIFCGEIGIMYGWEIVEEKDHPIPMGRLEFETSPNMKMVGWIITDTGGQWTTTIP